MYQLLLLLSFVVEEGLGKENHTMISFSQINAGNTANTLSTVHFRRAMGRRKLLGKVGGKNEIGCRFTTVVMLFYGCFSCVHSILVCWPPLRPDLWMIWPGSFCWSTFWLQRLLYSQRWRWSFDVNLLPPLPWCAFSSCQRGLTAPPSHASPFWAKTTHRGWTLPSPWAQARGAWERRSYLWPPGLLPRFPPQGMMASTEVTTIHSCHGGLFLLKVCERCPSFSSNTSSCWPLSRWS